MTLLLHSQILIQLLDLQLLGPLSSNLNLTSSRSPRNPPSTPLLLYLLLGFNYNRIPLQLHLHSNSLHKKPSLSTRATVL